MERPYSGGVQRRVIFEFWPKMDKLRHFRLRRFSENQWILYALLLSNGLRYSFLLFHMERSYSGGCNEGLFLIFSQKWTILDTLNIGDFLYVMSSLYVTLYVLCFVRALSRNPLNGFCSAIAYGKII